MSCQHNDAVPRLKGVKPNGSLWYRLQCAECGAPLQPTQLRHLIVRQYVKNGGCVELWDTTAEQRFLSYIHSSAAEIRKLYGWDNPSWWRRYDQYLRSSEWRCLRAQILMRDEYICRLCSSNRATQVHHTTYERVGHELPDDLLSVCQSCHDAVHNTK